MLGHNFRCVPSHLHQVNDPPECLSKEALLLGSEDQRGMQRESGILGAPGGEAGICWDYNLTYHLVI
jgi:hypothetical protein